MSRIEVKREKGNYRASLFYSNQKKNFFGEKADSWWILDKDKVKFSFFLQDLVMEGFPVEEAYKLMIERLHKKDWLGL